MHGPRNALYALLRTTKISICVLGPLLALIFRNVVKEVEALEYGALLIIGLAFVHYCSEGVIWRRNTIHRRYVVVR